MRDQLGKLAVAIRGTICRLGIDGQGGVQGPQRVVFLVAGGCEHLARAHRLGRRNSAGLRSWLLRCKNGAHVLEVAGLLPASTGVAGVPEAAGRGAGGPGRVVASGDAGDGEVRAPGLPRAGAG